MGVYIVESKYWGTEQAYKNGYIQAVKDMLEILKELQNNTKPNPQKSEEDKNAAGT